MFRKVKYGNIYYSITMGLDNSLDIDSIVNRLKNDPSIQRAMLACKTGIENSRDDLESWRTIIDQAIVLEENILNALDENEKPLFWDIMDGLMEIRYEFLLSKILGKVLLRRPEIYLKRIIILEEAASGLYSFSENTSLLIELVGRILVEEKRFREIPDIREIYDEINKSGDLFETIIILAGNETKLYSDILIILENNVGRYTPGEVATYIDLVEYAIRISLERGIDDITILTREINALIKNNNLANTDNGLYSLWKFYDEDVGQLYQKLVSTEAGKDYMKIIREN